METVAKENLNAPEQQRDDGIAGVDEVTIADLMQSATSENQTVDTQGQTDAPIPAQTSDDGSDEQIRDQASFDKALSKRLAKEREKYESSPEYLAGKELLQARMQSDNVDAREAYERIKAERVKAQAKAYAQNPEQFYADYLTKQNEPRTPELSPAELLSKQLIKASEDGLVPQDFNPSSDITPAFVQNMQKYGVEAALEIHKASKQARVREEVAQQKAAPRPMRVGGTTVPSSNVDFSTMSSKEFADFSKKVKQASMRGKRVTF